MAFSNIFWGIVAPLLLIIVPIVYPFNIVFGSVKILNYPWSMLLFIAIGIGLFVSFLAKTKKESKLKTADGSIVIEEGTVSYKDVVKGAVKNVSFKLSEINNVKYVEDDEELVVTTADSKEHTFDKTYFENESEFARFQGILK